MSLLLEALKKAELAKQAAKEQPASTPFTRDKLPDINQPVEINSEDLKLAEPAAPAIEEQPSKPKLELAIEDAPRAAPAPAPEPPAPAPRMTAPEPEFTAAPEPEERKQAQQLFEVKEMDVNPRKPFYITVGVLGVFALGTIGYFWYQLQPRSSFLAPQDGSKKSAPPPAPAPAAPIAAPAPAAAPASPLAATTPLSATPTGPGAAAAQSQQAPAAAKPAPSAPATPAASAPTRARGESARGASEPATARTAKRGGDISIAAAKPQTDPVLETGYQAFNAGDVARAREAYGQALRSNPNSRDALLGMAAVEMQSKRYDAAEALYARLLELDPRDAYALAGLIGLRGEGDPLGAESRLKTLIASQPDASFLHFSLGNQYAAQERWTEAQQSYFRAYSGDPEHPDFAYNLAVSLDKLHQPKLALEYYRRALALADKHPATFDRAQVSKRAAQLER